LKHFNVTALRYIFSVQSLEANIFFIGYRRVSRQLSIKGFFSGSAFHSKLNIIEGIKLPASPRVFDLPVV
jgi:hypothetical protein